MPENDNNIINKSGILLSRNSPIALVVGAAGFLGSNLVDKLLEHNIQVIGVDDLSVGAKSNLELAGKNKNFHFINKSILELEAFEAPRMDYAFFVISEVANGEVFTKGLIRFLDIIKKHKNTKILFSSNIDLYQRDLNTALGKIKNGEIILAKYVKEKMLNARIVRLGPMFGPRMHFKTNDPISRLIYAALSGELQNEQTSLDFLTRSLFVEDAVALLLKSVLLGLTSHKIYDGVSNEPIKIAEIKQILFDPLWHESHGFEPTKLPPWPTPNLNKTLKELSWKPKTSIIEALKKTISYYEKEGLPKEGILKNGVEEKYGIDLNQKRLFPETQNPQRNIKEEKPIIKKNQNSIRISPYYKKRSLPIKKMVFVSVTLLVIFYGLMFPAISLIVAAINIKNNLISSKRALYTGDFDNALGEINKAENSINQINKAFEFIDVAKRFGIENDKLNQFTKTIKLVQVAIESEKHGTFGMQELFKATKIISGEDLSNPKDVYRKAELELTLTSEKIKKVKLDLPQTILFENPPVFLKSRIGELKLRIDLYADLIEKMKIASYLIPEITAVEGKKTYLVLLQNNLELRPAGGFIGSYAKVDFEGGRIKRIVVDDVYNLDGSLKEKIEPPLEIKNDLGVDRWYLRDSNFEPDFPSSARQAQFFYGKEAGEKIQGVFALDLTGSGKLIDAIGGLELNDFQETITKENLFEEILAHTETNFFPGSQQKKNFLTNLQTELFNKLFFSTGQNWPYIAQALGESLEQKHLLIYLADPTLFSYLVSLNWAGVLSRQAGLIPGQTNDFLAVVEANFGANKTNYYLERAYSLQTNIDKEGKITHHLTIKYKNNSPSDAFPGGRYRNRFRIYLPSGTKLTKAFFGEKEIIKDFVGFSDYGRSGFSTLLEVFPKEQKELVLDYELKETLSFKADKNTYRLDLIKQAGVNNDSFNWRISYPVNFVIDNQTGLSINNQEINISTDLLKDRAFNLKFKR